MAPVVKVVLVMLGYFVSSAASGGDARTRRLELGRLLDVVFCLSICAFLATKLGAFELKPLEERGYDAIVPALLALAMLGLKGVVFVLLPAGLMCWFLRSFESLTPRLVIYGLFGVAGAAGWHFAQQRAEAQAAEAERRHEAAQQEQRRAQSEAESMEQARADAARREVDDRKKYQAQLLDLRNQARDRWRADVQAAGAFGGDGEFPPMLRVVDAGKYEMSITNLAPRRACVKLVRAMRKPGTDLYLRCPVDLYRDCVELMPRETRTFPLVLDERSPACQEKSFEFRVGTPLRPEPSWWSSSALRYFDENKPDMREPVISDETPTVRSEIARLEKMLAETDRAARWRNGR